MGTIVKVVLPEGNKSYQEFRDLPRKGDAVLIASDAGDLMFIVALVLHYSTDTASRKEQCPDVYVRRTTPEELRR